MQYACGGGINWSWYLGFEIETDKHGKPCIRILLHDRLHNHEPSQGSALHPDCGGKGYDILHNKSRTARRASIRENGVYTVYRVINPKYTFEYSTFNY